ncbi:MAG: hypothetical protein AAGJ79_15185 [Verrucomicrobiota bacterium]
MNNVIAPPVKHREFRHRPWWITILSRRIQDATLDTVLRPAEADTLSKNPPNPFQVHEP